MSKRSTTQDWNETKLGYRKLKRKLTVKYNDPITLKDIQALDICNHIFWEHRFNKLFPMGCKLNRSNIKKFFSYSHDNRYFIEMISADGILDREYNMHFGIRQLISHKGTDVQLDAFECNVEYSADCELSKRPDHRVFFRDVNRFFKKYTYKGK